MATNPDVTTLKPEKLRLTSDGLSETHASVVVLEWVEDHSVWASALASNCDDDAKEPRDMPSQKLQVRQDRAGDSPELEWKPTWPDDDLENQTQKEIYGVMRAEYYFIKERTDGPWRKIACKIGSQGIDSLFRKGSDFVICESKASKHYDKYLKYINIDSAGRRARNAFGALGTIKDPVDPDKTILQMSWNWIDKKIMQMISQGAKIRVTKRNPNLQAAEDVKHAKRQRIKQNGSALLDGQIQRWFNYYGTDPFYRLPGKYRIAATRSAEFVIAQAELPKNEKEFDWPGGDRSRDEEFIHLDKYEPFLSKAEELDRDGMDDGDFK